MSYNRCKDTHKFGNKYLPSAYKTQVDFWSHFSGKKSASYSPRNTVYGTSTKKLPALQTAFCLYRFTTSKEKTKVKKHLSN